MQGEGGEGEGVDNNVVEVDGPPVAALGGFSSLFFRHGCVCGCLRSQKQ